MIFLFLLTFGSMGALGDGVVINYESVDLLKEENQITIIHHENGLQRMVVSIQTEEVGTSRSVWIFPVPALPSSINISIEKTFPILKGENIEKAADKELNDLKRSIHMMHFASLIPMGRILLGMDSMSDSTGSLGEKGSVSIHKVIEADGVHSEVVSSLSGTDILDHLKNNGLDISTDLLPQLDHYIDGDFTFILSWIVNISELGARPGIYLEFPTEQIFYPMYLTSAYGDTRIPVDIIILDHVIPDNREELGYSIKCTYFGSAYMYVIDNEGTTYSTWEENCGEISCFLGAVSGDMYRFTLMEIDTEAQNFDRDLTFSSYQPKVRELNWDDEWGSAVFTMFLFSLLSSILLSTSISYILFKDDKKQMGRYALMGLLNPFWIFLFVITFTLVSVISKSDWKRSLVYLFCFLVLHSLSIVMFVELYFHIKF